MAMIPDSLVVLPAVRIFPGVKGLASVVAFHLEQDGVIFAV